MSNAEQQIPPDQPADFERYVRDEIEREDKLFYERTKIFLTTNTVFIGLAGLNAGEGPLTGGLLLAMLGLFLIINLIWSYTTHRHSDRVRRLKKQRSYPFNSLIGARPRRPGAHFLIGSLIPAVMSGMVISAVSYSGLKEKNIATDDWHRWLAIIVATYLIAWAVIVIGYWKYGEAPS